MPNPFKTMRIGFLFFFGFVFIVVFLVAVIVWISYSSSSKEIAATTSHYQQKLLYEMNKKLTTKLVDIEQSSNTATKSFDVIFNWYQDGSKYDKVRAQAEIRSQLNNYVYGSQVLDSIHVYSMLPANYNLQEYVQFLPFEQVKSEDWYPLIENSDVAWINEHTVKTNRGDTSMISFARKVYNSANRYYAMIVVNIKVPVFRSLIESEGTPSDVALLDMTGKLITKTDKSDFSRAQLDQVLFQLQNNPAGAQRTGNEFLVWAESVDSKWTLIQKTSWSEMTQNTVKITRIFLLLGLVAVLLIIVLAILIARQFMIPMKLLLRAMSDFSMYKADTLPSDYKNEFGQLFQGFKKMIARIEELYGNLEDQYEKRRAAEIKSLQIMINPHFLYNSLDQVNWMAISAGQQKISEMLAHLGQLFRMALNNTNSLVLLDEEIDHIQCYLRFQQIRWGERLEYDISMDKDVDQYHVPRIILQPFIENAFVHGFHGKRSAKLTISIVVTEERLIIKIEDNGRGLSGRNTPSNGDPTYIKRGHGLTNVKERIDALFGESYGFQLLESQLGGVKVLIQLPVIRGEEVNVENRDCR
ncbi:sensor histidine kinase [Paenibacillus illinoisensis]|uniref:sensor histidine kinase n=1 Tax=Paenibacillus illinoisensis TaxID=59845 RepID=UPI003CED8D89